MVKLFGRRSFPIFPYARKYNTVARMATISRGLAKTKFPEIITHIVVLTLRGTKSRRSRFIYLYSDKGLAMYVMYGRRFSFVNISDRTRIKEVAITRKRIGENENNKCAACCSRSSPRLEPKRICLSSVLEYRPARETAFNFSFDFSTFRYGRPAVVMLPASRIRTVTNARPLTEYFLTPYGNRRIIIIVIVRRRV